jgi:hypothetical protein
MTTRARASAGEWRGLFAPWGRACGPLAMIRQAALEIACPSQVMPHLALVRPLEMQQVHSTLNRHERMITRARSREQVRKLPLSRAN